MKNLELTYLKALELSTNGKLKEAKLMAHEMLNEDPSYGKAHYLLGWVHMEESNDIIKAVYHTQEAIKLAPDFLMSYYLYCDIMVEANKPENLKKAIESAIGMSGIDKAYLYHKLACAYENKKQYQNSIAYLRQSQFLSNAENWQDFIANEIIRVRRKMGLVRNFATALN